MRAQSILLALYLSAGPVVAQTAERQQASSGEEYQLGGAVELAATLPRERIVTVPQLQKLLPLRALELTLGAPLRKSRRATALGDLAIFARDKDEDGADILQLGSSLTRGRATAGLSLTYRETAEPSRSELFLDYALTETFSIGVSGILEEGADGALPPITGLGLNAALSDGDGTFLQGGIADAPDTTPVFGLSLGFSF